MNDRNVASKKLVITLGLGLAFASFHAATASAEDQHLQNAVKEGSQLFAKETFNGKGSTCATCHQGGGKSEGKGPNGMKIPSLSNAAAIFPRYNPRAGKVTTLTMQINGCIHNGLGGKPIAYDSTQMVALESYLASLAKGKSMDMGGKPK